MEKELFKKLVEGIVFIITAGFVLSAGAYGANPQSVRNSDNSENRLRNTSRTTGGQFNGITAGPSSFTPDMHFGDAIDILRNSTKPPLNIVVLWRDLEENAEIYRDTPIGMDGVSGIRLGKQLELLLLSVSSGALADLGYVVDKGVIIIATKDSLPRRAVTRLYYVADLVSAPANYFLPIGFGGPFIGPFGGMPGGIGPYGGYGGGYSGAYGGPYGFAGQYGLQGSSYNRGRELSGLINSFYGPNRNTRRRSR